MSDEEFPDSEPATDPAELERVMKLAENPAYQGLMFRLLLGARLWIPIPAHPEMVGEHLMDVTGGFSWCAYKDHEGEFTPAFTTEAIARETMQQVRPEPMIAEIGARTLFSILRDKPMKVRIIASNRTRLVMDPEALDPLLDGSFTENTGKKGAAQKTMLQPLAPEDVPPQLRQAIRAFCTQRQGAMAVYAFHPIDEETKAIDRNDLRFIVRLRDHSGDFYNDFSLMVARLKPEDCQVLTAAASLEDEEGMEFLQRCTPLWPVLAESEAGNT